MNVILEGPDGSGKSTLAHMIAQHVPLTYTPGRGPEQYKGEIVERARRYLRMDNCLFDRHPATSQPIYGRFREGATMIPQDVLDEFYAKKPLIIFCDSNRGLDQGHELKEYDTPEHVAMVERFDHNIRAAYRVWAAVYADHRYEIGDDIEPIIQACREYCK